jgi:hypothetical protein
MDFITDPIYDAWIFLLAKALLLGNSIIESIPAVNWPVSHSDIREVSIAMSQANCILPLSEAAAVTQYVLIGFLSYGVIRLGLRLMPWIA